MNVFFKKYIILLALFVVGVAYHVSAQVTVNASIDSLQLYIGEQARIKLEVSCPSGKQLDMPQYDQMLIDGIEIVGEVKADTQYLNKNSHVLVTHEYTVTSFDTAFYYIPPFEVLVDSHSYASNPLALKIYPFAIDTTEVNAIFPIKAVVECPIRLSDVWPMLLAMLLILVVGALVPYLLLRYKDNKPILRRVTIAPKLPPHQVALQEMTRIKEEKSWHREDPKQYYTELTDVLRAYMEERFGFNAREMTSDEILDRLNEQPDKEWIDELKSLFSMSDLVKFAKYKPLINEGDMHLVNAVDFINKTKVETAPTAPVVREIIVKEGRSKQERILLLVGIIVLSVCGLAALFVALSRIVHLFF